MSDAPIDYVPKHLSYSGASTYKQCPARWKYQYIDKRILIQPSSITVLGRFVHEVLENLYKEEPTDRNKEKARSIATSIFKSFSEEDREWEMLQLTGDEIKQFKSQAWWYVEGVWELEDPEKVDVVELECELDIELDGVPFKGMIDRVEREKGKLVISDYKTGNIPQRSVYIADKMKQIYLYAAVYEQKEEVEVKKGRLIFLGGKNSQATIGAKQTQGAKDEHVETWGNIHDSIKNNDFPASTGPLCAWCPHVDICEEGQQEVLDRLNGVKGRKPRKDAPALAIMKEIGLI